MELISFGDPNFMAAVLRAIAMMSNVGTFASLGAIGLVIGLVLMAFQGLSKGQIDLGGWAASLILYLVMFTIPAQVVLIEKTPGWGRQFVRAPIVIDDVPMGVAAMGWFVSQTGYRLSQRMEEAFSIPSDGASVGSLLQGFGRTLEVLALVRDAQHPIIVGGADSSLQYTAFRKSMVAYLSDCTAPKLAGNLGEEMRMLAADNPLTMEGIGFASGAHRTTNYRVQPSGGTAPPTIVSEPDRSCADQIGVLQDRQADAYEGYYKSVLGRISPNGADSTTTANEAYAVLGMTATEAQQFVLAHIIKGSMAEAMKRGANGHEVLLGMMVDEAAVQRASQFAGEESMFLRMARPMIAFFETVVYIAAPFMALAIGFGRVGQGMVLKYALLTVWVALWMPTLSALNMFSSYMASNAIWATLNTADGQARKPIGSLVGAEQVLSQAEDWLGTAALLMASTPAITLMLIFGSAMTAVGLANRVQGADTINEKGPTPDAMGTSAGIAAQALGSSSAVGGFRQTGAPSYMLNTANATSAGVSAASSELASVESGFTQQWGSRVANTLSSGFSAAAQRGNEARLGALVSGTESAIASREVRDALEGLTDSQKASVFEYVGRTQAGAELGLDAGAMSRNAGGKSAKKSDGGEQQDGGGTAGAGPVSAGFRVGGSADSVERQSNSQTAVQRAAQTILGAMRNDSGIRGEVSNALAQTAATIGRMEGGEKNEAVNSAEFAQQARALNQASENYQKTQAASNSFGAQRSVDLAAVGQGLANNPEGMAALRQAVSQFGGGQDGLNEAKHRANTDFNQFGTGDQKEAMALIDQLAGNGSVQGPKAFADERLQAISDAMRSAGFGGMSGGQPASGAGNAIEASGPGGPSTTAAAVEGAVAANLEKVDPAGVRAAAATQPSLGDPRLEAASGSDAAAVDAAGGNAAQLGTDPTNVQRGEQFNAGADRLELQSADERNAVARGGAETAVRGAIADNESGIMDNVTWEMAPSSWGGDVGGEGMPTLGAYQAAAHGALPRSDDVPPEMAQVAGFIAAYNHGGGAWNPSEEQANAYDAAVSQLSPEQRLAAMAMAETMGQGPEGSGDVPVTNAATTAMARVAELPMSQTQELLAPYGKEPTERDMGERWVQDAGEE